MESSCDLIWFRRDLRLSDNDLLAVEPHAEAMLCVFVLEPCWLDGTASAQTVPQWSLLWQSLIDLRGTLLTRGSDLLVCVGEPAQLLPRLAQRIGAQRVITHAMEGANECATTRRVQAALAPDQLCVLPDSPLFPAHHDDTEIRELSFGEFVDRSRGRSALAPRSPGQPFTLPPWPQDGPRGLPPLGSLLGDVEPLAATMSGGEPAAQARLRQLRDAPGEWDSEDVRELLRWRALGCVSARQLYALCERMEVTAGAEHPQRDLRHELLWHEYLRRQQVYGADVSRFQPACIDPSGGSEPGLLRAEGAPHVQSAGSVTVLRQETLREETPRHREPTPAAAPRHGSGSWFDRY
ncbi:deoxyribodipyrimidine photo-lyase [Salinicola sp. DM10]|uniref:deoxyribodipyrimidine photo-lyase n=1 Tax=Salinicola sp. DM10 TaxID=2815721 RepID=UPI001A8DFECD|nr:deoxyribodipyrimidine photo-lyase [Salinicola sp. DM10]MCE3028234.1 deoxyribodipyrimidine photo-lyase [Salinicola sp. DM10]